MTIKYILIYQRNELHLKLNRLVSCYTLSNDMLKHWAFSGLKADLMACLYTACTVHGLSNEIPSY